MAQSQQLSGSCLAFFSSPLEKVKVPLHFDEHGRRKPQKISESMSTALVYASSCVAAGLGMRFKMFEGRATVVRAIDYLHYPEEKALYLFRFFALCMILLHRGQLMKFLGFTCFGTAQVLIQEYFCQAQGVRKMNEKFPNAFFEGGVYFACPFGLALVGNGLFNNFAFILLLLSFSLARGWPRNSSEHLSRRDVGSSIVPRLIQLLFAFAYSPPEKCRDLTVAMVKIKFLSMLIYLVGLRLLHRSFVLVDHKMPSLLVDLLLILFRAVEPVVGAVGLALPATSILGYC